MARQKIDARSRATSVFPWIAPNAYLDELRSLYADIEARIPWTNTAPTLQSSIQTCSKFPNDLLIGCGSAPTLPVGEAEFCNLPDIYRDTVVSEVLKSLPFPVIRLRWMKLLGKGCYSIHRDYTPRLHIPVITNRDAHFAFSDEGLFHLAEGGVYAVDTTKEHSFLNGNPEPRIHLVGVLPNLSFASEMASLG